MSSFSSYSSYHSPRIDGNRSSRRRVLLQGGDEIEVITESPRCKCREYSKVWTAWKHTNPGRRFFGCRKYNDGGCDFFEWIDNEMCQRAKDVINELNTERKKLIRENAILARSEGNLVFAANKVALPAFTDEMEELIELRNELQRQLQEMGRVNKAFKFVVGISWGLFLVFMLLLLK